MLKPKPVGYNIAVIDIAADSETESGIIIPGESQEKPVIAKVFAVGDDVTNVEVGDLIAHKQNRGTLIKIKGNPTEYLILIKGDLLTKLEEVDE